MPMRYTLRLVAQSVGTTRILGRGPVGRASFPVDACRVERGIELAHESMGGPHRRRAVAAAKPSMTTRSSGREGRLVSSGRVVAVAPECRQIALRILPAVLPRRILGHVDREPGLHVAR